ncbi:MAG: ABC transporter permease subunit, partial [Gammaproteobacteria bacterium]|nr:ABC transporter permease subunit [Gammaproteobacteria bacterium]
MIRVIARQEVIAALRSPVAWVMYAALQFILAWQFLAGLETYLQLQPRLKLMVNPPGVNEIVIAPVMAMAGMLLLFVAPLITMRTIADERRARTLVLYLKAPIRPGTVILGKFLGCVAQLLPIIVSLAFMFAVLALTAPVDGGQLAPGARIARR